MATWTFPVLSENLKRALASRLESSENYAKTNTVEFVRFARKCGVDRVITAPADWAQNNNDDLLFAHYKAVAQELPIMLMTALGKRPLPLNVIEETVNTVPELIAIKDDICRHYGQHVATFARKGDVTLLSGGRMEDHLEVLSLWLQFLVVHFYALYAAHRLGLLGGRAGEEYVAWS